MQYSKEARCGIVNSAINPSIWDASKDGLKNLMTKKMRKRKSSLRSDKAREMGLILRKRKRGNLRVRLAKQPKNLLLSSVGLVQTATTATLKIRCLGIYASVKGTMNQLFLPYFSHILVENTVIRKRVNTASMESAIFYAIQAVVHPVASTYQSNATVAKIPKECLALYRKEANIVANKSAVSF